MLGNPIFGVGYVRQTTKGGTRPQAQQPTGVPPVPAKPGLFAPRAEKHLWKATVAQDAAAAIRAGEESSDHRVAAYTIAAWLLAKTEPQRSKQLLAQVFDSTEDPASDPFIQKYVTSLIELGIAPGVRVELPICRDAVGLLLAEFQQDDGEIDQAITTVEQLEPSTHAAVSLAELYSQRGRHEEVVELTDNLANADDATALLLVYRGVALREQGFLDGSLEAFKEALRARSRDQAIRNLAYSERARTYATQGKKAMARKDLERILAADSSYEGVRERLREVE
jgi:tetratricopeptide (TPR) repeat protein